MKEILSSEADDLQLLAAMFNDWVQPSNPYLAAMQTMCTVLGIPESQALPMLNAMYANDEAIDAALDTIRTANIPIHIDDIQ